MSVSLPSTAKPTQTAFAPLHVASADIDHVRLQPAPPVAVTGHVQYRISGDVRSVASSIQLELRAPSPLAAQAGAVEWDPTRSSFTFPAVQPGTYQLSLRVRGAYASAAMFGGKDILDQEITITNSAEPIEIALQDNFGRVEGVITDAQGKPGNPYLYFFRDGRDPIFGSTLRGAFTGLLPPGDYRVIPVGDLTKVFYAEPEWRSKQLSGAQRVTVRPGELTRVSITQEPN